jgi:hypothetical protein
MTALAGFCRFLLFFVGTWAYGLTQVSDRQMGILQVSRFRHLEVERSLPLIRKRLGRVLRSDSSSSDVTAPLPRTDSHYLAEGAREGCLIAEARLNCYVRNRRGRLPK